MKKSGHVTLTLVAAAALASCNRQRPIDPCEAATFNEMACNDAVRSGGYHYGGRWVPMYYSHPYPYYYDSFRGYTARGGYVRSAPAGAYAGSSSSHSSGVTRGGFGSTGASHGGSGGGAGA